MTVPMSVHGEDELTRPDAADVDLIARTLATAAVPPSGLTDVQRGMI